MIRVTTFAVACLLALSAMIWTPERVTAQDTPAPMANIDPPLSPIGFVKGYTWGWWGRNGRWAAPAAAESMAELAKTHTEWATLAFVAHMPRHDIPMIAWADADPRMVSDAEIERGIKLARKHEMKIILKPTFDCLDGVWRGKVAFTTQAGKPDAEAWDLWWKTYTAFMLHYAKLAEAHDIEALVVGCELSSTEGFEKEWRALIAEVRKVYDGALIYNCAHLRESEITWWDAVDIIGVSAYYTVGTDDDASVETMVKNYQPHLERLRKLALKWKRPIMFIEIGCRSAWGSQVWPGDFRNWDWPVNQDVQANFYEASLRATWDQPWFCGYSWWDWPARLYDKDTAAHDKQFYIYGKKAQDVLTKWYAKERR